jgi:hypothetical protein
MPFLKQGKYTQVVLHHVEDESLVRAPSTATFWRRGWIPVEDAIHIRLSCRWLTRAFGGGPSWCSVEVFNFANAAGDVRNSAAV